MNTFCTYFNTKTCQSCRFIEVDYSEQLKAKENRLKAGLSKIKGWVMLPPVASKNLGFRNKAKMIVTGTIDQPVIGLPGNTDLDSGREILDCPVHSQVINDILAGLPEFITMAKIAPYEIESRKGELKGVIVYYSETSHEAYLRFVLRSKEAISRLQKHLPVLRNKFPVLTCFSANIQPVPHAILEGEEEVILSEQHFIKHVIHDVEFRLGPKGFVQTNQLMAQKLYQTAAYWAEGLQIKKFVELFCGQGAFSFFMAKFVEQSVGFEINPDAVAAANATVTTLGIKNMNFKCADAANVGPEIKAISPDLLLVNPPRRGMADSISILKDTPWPYVIYSSCSVDTLIKDLTELDHLYEIHKVQLFDMFPHTEHFETLVLLKSRT
ncbi:MAG TPA: methyltransferase domain-containing protein [Bacteriovoracaceae bacterium]|nr:methyltransferase domain-containing protein [Bacteriovoracaceae bacterium]